MLISSRTFNNPLPSNFLWWSTVFRYLPGKGRDAEVGSVLNWSSRRLIIIITLKAGLYFTSLQEICMYVGLCMITIIFFFLAVIDCLSTYLSTFLFFVKFHIWYWKPRSLTSSPVYELRRQPWLKHAYLCEIELRVKRPCSRPRMEAGICEPEFGVYITCKVSMYVHKNLEPN